MNPAHYIPFYKRILSLALPIIISQVGQVTVSLADNIMVGHVGTAELAAASFANNIFTLGMFFGMGIAIGMTPLVGKAFGNNNHQLVAAWLKNGLLTHLTAAVILTGLIFGIYFLLPYMGQTENVLKLARPYYLLLCASYMPFMLFFSLKQFFEGIENTKIAMKITLIANAINIVVNYIFIYGKLGLPAFGLVGAGIGTLASRIAMPLLFIFFILKNQRFRHYFAIARKRKFNIKRIASLLKIGIPIGFQIVIEMLTFSLGAIMMGWLGEIPLAAHQVAYGLISFTYMIPLGISQATTIRVSLQLGRNDYASLKKAVYASTHLVLVFMMFTGIIFVSSRNFLPLIFTTDPGVVIIASGLLIVAAFFQLFDGLQVIMLSTLRGMADVRIPMIIAFGAYLVIGLPTSYIFAFIFNAGPSGIWYGFMVGLGIAGIFFYLRFRRIILKKA